MCDITAHWCGTVWETAETLLNFNSRDLWCIWSGGTGVEGQLGAVFYLCNFCSDLVQYDFNLGASFIAHSHSTDPRLLKERQECCFSHRGPFKGRVMKQNSFMLCATVGRRVQLNALRPRDLTITWLSW